MIDLRLGFIAFGSFVIMFLFFRIVAVASMTAALTTSVIGAFLVSGDIAYMVIFISILIFWRHRENVVRILEGKEKKI
jgi:glycerol-3-phosphate acyltransferase PlsY